MNVLTAACLLGLVGCAADAPQVSGPDAFCNGVAARDPAVKALILRGISDPGFASYAPAAIADAKAKSKAVCLRRQGVLPAGDGVQAPSAARGTLFQ